MSLAYNLTSINLFTTIMDPGHISPEGSEDEDTNAMAAFMGFSAFGSHKPPTKKRKFNPTTDAFVEGQELAKLDRGGKKGAGSGGNMMPLGKARVFGERRGNEDEIELDLDEQDNDGPRYMDTSLPPPAEAGLKGGRTGDAEEGEGARYMDTSLPAPADLEREREEDDGRGNVETNEVSHEEAAEMQARIDAILASIGSDPNPAENDDAATATSTLPPPSSLPKRPVFSATSDTEFMQGASRGRAFSGATSTSSRGGRGRGRGGGGRDRREISEKWYEDYYDPTFNENPWARLEKEKGLPSIGTWLENQP